MDWRTETKPAFKIIAQKRYFNEETALAGIPAFYNEYAHGADKYKVSAKIGICFTPEFGSDWVYAIGDFLYAGGICPDGFEEIDFKEQLWAVFTGDNGNSITNFIYTEWFLTSDYEILPGNTLEFYNQDSEITEIWVPVAHK